jgi:hypothetical protein
VLTVQDDELVVRWHNPEAPEAPAEAMEAVA